MKNLEDFIKVYDSVLNKQACETMIRMHDDNPQRLSEYNWNLGYRRFSEVNSVNVPAAKEFLDVYYSRIDSVYSHYKKSVDIPFLPDKDSYTYEHVRIKKYEANDKDEFGLHVDVGDSDSSKRFLTFFIYLNDVDEGGETAFQDINNLDVLIKPKQGRMVVFPPMWMFPHRGLRPISNDKYIASTYLHYI